MSDTERRALDALAAQEATTRQERLPEDKRLMMAREYAEKHSDGGVRLVLADLIAYCEERLAVNRGLLAQSKPQEPVSQPTLLSSLGDARQALEQALACLNEVEVSPS